MKARNGIDKIDPETVSEEMTVNVALDSFKKFFRKLLKVKHNSSRKCLAMSIMQSEALSKKLLFSRNEEEKESIRNQLEQHANIVKSLDFNDALPPGDEAYDLIMSSIRVINEVDDISSYIETQTPEEQLQDIRNILEDENEFNRARDNLLKMIETHTNKQKNEDDANDELL
jgi:hypothetical protein